MKKTNRHRKKHISEGLNFEDLKGLVSNTIKIDLYKPKIGDVEDTVVVSFGISYEEPARDLTNFIETSIIEHLDVETSSAPDQDGTWQVFVEFQRDHNLFDKIQKMLDDIDQITSRDSGQWKYRAYQVKKEKPFNERNFKNDVIDSRYEYRKKYIRKEEPSKLQPIEENWLKKIREIQKKNA